MGDLPSGTVSLVFSDIEGSTVLLSRLGPAYADALDTQRRILREAWATHGGSELGTEGDSFFVGFATAEAAVAAAVQAQRELAAFDWPAGERVRVRMGIHTGAPTIHDGGYVGMDVHRAARIAGAAHGGQVVVSVTTARLVSTHLADDVGLRDLGRHQLKDLAEAEHLFQLDIAGLQTEFAALKSLGAASSLPAPATSLVGRDGELAELTALLSSPGVRLVTLTGPGGSGKTRLAVGLARRLVEVFPDGVFFVSLAAVTTPEGMWTRIGEVLDVPPQGRIPPGFFTHVAHRSALFVLDNLEQLPGADAAVSQLLAEAPQVVVVATSRRPLHLAGEHEHPVPTLELPDHPSLESAERSGAVQMFVQHAQMVRPTFTLTETNAASVVQVCRRLDGLPLAIELAAARSKLLSPAALVTRLDTALELKDTGVDRPTRQQTLRDTIAWSYNLLNPSQQGFFRRLGVFAGGADLDAITAVTAGATDDADPFDLVADIVDASLVTVSDGPDGEPRVGMLETIRTYALDQLQHTGELDDIRRRHANYYVSVAEQLSPLTNGGGEDLLAARRGLELELDNFREALGWALQPDDLGPPSDLVKVGLRVCSELARLWTRGGYFAEGRRWLELAIARSGDEESPELASCLQWLGWLSLVPGHLDRGLEAATRSVAMWRRLGDMEGLSLALSRLAVHQESFGDLQAARGAAEEAVSLARDVEAKYQLANALATLSNLEALDLNFERALELVTAALDISLELGQEHGVLICREIQACTLRELGRLEEAYQLMRDQIPPNLQFPSPENLMILAEDFGAVLADIGEHERAAQLLGAADAMRERHVQPRRPTQADEIEEPFGKARAALAAGTWELEYERGHNMSVEEALKEAHSSPRRLETSQVGNSDSADGTRPR